MTAQTKTIVTQHQKQLSNTQLFAQYELLEVRKNKLLENLRECNCALYRMKYRNAVEWQAAIYAELEKRICQIDIGIFEMLIESDFTFSILD